MRIEFDRRASLKNREEYPRKMHDRKFWELQSWKLLLCLLAAAIVVFGPARLIAIENPREYTGYFSEAKLIVTGGRRTRAEIRLLDITVDGRIFRISHQDIPGDLTLLRDHLLDVNPVNIQYVDGLFVSNEVGGISSGDATIMDYSYPLATWRRDCIGFTLAGIGIFIFCAICLLFRSGYLKFRRDG